MTLSKVTFTLLASTVLVAAPLAGCSGGSSGGDAKCLEDASGYIPQQLDGRDVVTQDRVVESLVKDVEREGVSSIASGYINSDVAPATTQPGEAPLTRPDGTPIPPDDPTQKLPEVIVLAAVGQPDVVKQVDLDPGTGTDTPSHTVDADGVTITIREFSGQTELQTALATAQPCDTVILIAFAFKNGSPAAESAIRGMLDASKSH